MEYTGTVRQVDRKTGGLEYAGGWVDRRNKIHINKLTDGHVDSKTREMESTGTAR